MLRITIQGSRARPRAADLRRPPEWPPQTPYPRSNLSPARSAPSAGGSTWAAEGGPQAPDLAPARSLPSAGSFMAGRAVTPPARSASSASSLLSPYPSRGASGAQARSPAVT